MENKVLKIKNGRMQTNTYLIGNNNEGCYVIDPSDDYLIIKRNIENNFADKVKAILLTHGHLDHIGSVDRLVKEYNCDVYLCEQDNYLIDGSLNRYPNMLQDFNIVLNSPTLDAYSLNDNNIIVIETPGHTPGSVCYLFKNELALFSGDTLFCMGVGRCDLPGGSERELRNSLKELKKLDSRLKVYPGHEAVSTLDKELKSNPYLQRL